MGLLDRALPDRLLAWRDRTLASPDFQRWASGNPLTRPIARRRARALFDLCAGFVYSQILLACVQLRLFHHLASPRGAPELAPLLGLTSDATERLLAAAAALRLVSRRGGGRWGLGALGAALGGNPGVAAMIAHHPLLYDDLRDPVALLRGGHAAGALARYWPYAGADAAGALAGGQVAGYSALMAASQPLVAGDVLDAYPLRRHRCLLDVGGGEGAFLIAAAARAPALRLLLFDLPAVAERARERLARADLAARAQAIGGDFTADPLPHGADVIALLRVIHDHDDERAVKILRATRAALAAGGRLLLAEPMAGTAGAEPVGDAYFGFYLLAMGSGRPRTPATLLAMLAEAGFTHAKLLATRRPMLVRLIMAEV